MHLISGMTRRNFSNKTLPVISYINQFLLVKMVLPRKPVHPVMRTDLSL